MSFAEPSCPVCGASAVGATRPGATCSDCAWPLRTEWLPGPGDPAAFTRRLERARTTHDLKAAARAGGGARRFIRGRVTDLEWRRALAEARGEPFEHPVPPFGPAQPSFGPAQHNEVAPDWLFGGADEAAPRVRFSKPSDGEPPDGGGPATGTARDGSSGADGERAEEVIAAVLRESSGRAVLVEVGVDGVDLLFLQTDDADPVRRRERTHWRDAAPMLAVDPDQLRFQLAGGLYGLDRTVLIATLGLRLSELPGRIPPGTPMAFVCTAPGWPVPEQAVAALARIRPDARAVKSPVPAAEVLRAAAARLPLRTGYALVLAEDTPGGTRPAAVPLFPAGSVPGAEATVRVRRGPGGDHDVALTVVPDIGDEGYLNPVSITAARLPRGGSAVRAVLDAPGRIRWVEPPGTRPDPRTIQELFDQASASAAAPGRVELLVAVELGGPPVQAAMRRELVAGILDLVAAELPDRARVTVYGYHEHSFRLGREAAPVAEGFWRSAPDAARAAFDLLPQAPPEATWQADAAPLEDALEEIAHRLARDAPAIPRTLLVLAGRPPHPRRQGQDPERELAQPCPRRHDWRDAHDVLRRAGTRFVAVLDKDAVPGSRELPGGGAWSALAADHLAVLEDAGTQPLALVDALGLVPAGLPRLPFPLKG